MQEAPVGRRQIHAMAVLVLVEMLLGSCVRMGFDSREITPDSGAGTLVFPDGGQGYAVGPVSDANGEDMPVKADLLPGADGSSAAPQGCSPLVQWESCDPFCVCESGNTCYLWCPPEASLCRIDCLNNASCVVVCDGRCSITSTGSTCSHCCRGSFCASVGCPKECPAPGCS